MILPPSLSFILELTVNHVHHVVIILLTNHIHPTVIPRHRTWRRSRKNALVHLVSDLPRQSNAPSL